MQIFYFYRIKGVILQFFFLQEWSYIPVGGSLPNTEQKNLAFGTAASMVHPATGKEIDELDNVIFYSIQIKWAYISTFTKQGIQL
jgi:hypothetical protein